MSNSSPSLKAGVTGFQQPVESIKQFITGSVFPYTRHIFQILPEAVFVRPPAIVEYLSEAVLDLPPPIVE